jgi:alpha-ribazole phosphatase
MEVYLIRHTTPQIEKGICYGQSDILLADTFQKESSKLLEYLPDKIDTVYSSPSSRCMKLAELIKPDQKITQDKRLMEMNFGDWEMKKWDEIDKPELNKWMADFVNEKATGGECFEELHQRVKSFFNENMLEAPNAADSVAVITHGGVIRSVLCQVLEIPLRNAFKIPIDYGSITRINIDGKSCYQNIEYINKT